MAKKTSKRRKIKGGGVVTLKLTLDDLKRITAGGSSFGGDSWQQVTWGKIDLGVERIQPRVRVTARKRAKKSRG